MKASDLYKDQMGLEPVDFSKIYRISEQIKRLIDADIEDEGEEDAQREADLKDIYNPLTNDEKMSVHGMLKDKAPDSNRMYRSILMIYVERT